MLEAWRGVLATLGAEAPAAAQLAEGQSASDASAAIDAWDSWASTHDAPAVEIMLGRNAPTISPGWPAVERRAAALGSAIAGAVSALRGAYADALTDGLLTRLRFSDLAALWWLDSRLQRQVSRPPSEGGSIGAGGLAVLLLLVAFAGGRRRGR